MNDRKATVARAHHSDEESRGRPIAMLAIDVVTTLHEPIHNNGDQTIGQLVDEQLVKLARDGKEVRTVRFDIEREQWFDLARSITEA